MKRPRKAPEPGTALAVIDRTTTAVELARDRERVRETAQHSKADRTRHEYARACRTFAAWCEARGLVARDPNPATAADTVSLYLQHRFDAGRSRATVEQDLAAIAFAYRDAGLSSPTGDPGFRAFAAGLRRMYAGRIAKPKAAATDAELAAMLGTLPATMIGTRDRALLALAWFGAMRRSEVVGLDLADVEEDRSGIVVTVRRSKTDQLGAGMRKAIPAYPALPERCPVAAVRAWLEVRGAEPGPLFRAVDRHGRVSRARMDSSSVALVVKRAATAAGLDPAVYAGHSLRRGFITTAARNGCSERSIANQTGHRSMPVLRAYIERATVFEDNAATALVGLVASRPVAAR